MKLLAILCSILSLAACQDLPGDETRSSPPAIRAITLADWSPSGYANPAVATELSRLANLGATHVVIVLTAYQKDATSPTVEVDPGRSPSKSSVRQLITMARQSGLAVGLKPHVDLDDGSWRGRIRPADPERWFGSYAAFALPWAELAAEENADLFFVGTELARTLEHESEWRAVVRQLRDAFGGDLVYAASWDEADDVPFWDALDFIGVNAYFPLTASQSPSRLDLLAGWQPWMWRVKRLHAQSQRPVLFSEVGYRSVDGAARAPFEFQSNASYDGAEQADLYWALMEATGDHSWLEGVVLWNWLARGGGGPGDTDYTLRGKPAEAVLFDAWTDP